jgi:hypothetical protein
MVNEVGIAKSHRKNANEVFVQTVIFRKKDLKIIIKNCLCSSMFRDPLLLAYHRRPKIIDTSCKAYPDPEFVNL